MKGETVEELAGLLSAMQDASEYVPLNDLDGVIDTCGTGGDRSHSINVSTIAAFVVAGAGAKVCKHGNRAASSACGSADVLEALGVVIDLPPRATEQLAGETGIVFLFAPLYHPALRHTAVPRRELGVPTVFNFLGPVCNPARPGALAVGVADPRMGPVVAGVLAGRGNSALVFHGDDGLDELTTTTSSTVWVVHGGTVSRADFDPADLGIAASAPEDLRGGDAAHNAAVARAVLAGQPGPVRDTVLLNAAAALAAESGVPDPGLLRQALADGFARAARAVDSGAASALLTRWVEASQRLAAESR
jgi:anthranilate phosphoribosyltransferase